MVDVLWLTIKTIFFVMMLLVARVIDLLVSSHVAIAALATILIVASVMMVMRRAARPAFFDDDDEPHLWLSTSPPKVLEKIKTIRKSLFFTDDEASAEASTGDDDDEHLSVERESTITDPAAINDSTLPLSTVSDTPNLTTRSGRKVRPPVRLTFKKSNANAFVMANGVPSSIRKQE
jgi:hypothetical protein